MEHQRNINIAKKIAAERIRVPDDMIESLFGWRKPEKVSFIKFQKLLRKDKRFTRNIDTTTLADSFIRGNETIKSSQSQNLAIPGPSQLTQRNCEPRNSNRLQSSYDFQQNTQKSIERPQRSQYNNSDHSGHVRGHSTGGSLRCQASLPPKVKEPTLAQVSLPSPIYGFDESAQTNRKQSNPKIDTQQFLLNHEDERQATVRSETSQISKDVDRLELESLAQLDQTYDEEETQQDEMYWNCEPSFIQPVQLEDNDSDDMNFAFV